jgi:hypothetical protein
MLTERPGTCIKATYEEAGRSPLRGPGRPTVLAPLSLCTGVRGRGVLRRRIALGACRFAARPGESEAWVAGTCYDPTDKRSPRIMEEGGASRSPRRSPPSSGSRPSSGASPLRARVRQAKTPRAHHSDRCQRVRPLPRRRAPSWPYGEAGGGQVRARFLRAEP